MVEFLNQEKKGPSIMNIFQYGWWWLGDSWSRDSYDIILYGETRDMPPCTGIRVNTDYERIAFELVSPESCATHYCGQRANHSAVGQKNGLATNDNKSLTTFQLQQAHDQMTCPACARYPWRSPMLVFLAVEWCWSRATWTVPGYLTDDASLLRAFPMPRKGRHQLRLTFSSFDRIQYERCSFNMKWVVQKKSR